MPDEIRLRWSSPGRRAACSAPPFSHGDRPADVIALDIGGTTAKCSLVADGRMRMTTEYRIEASQFNPGLPDQAARHRYRRDRHGRRLARLVRRRRQASCRAGSAGANPGPVVYGRGGDRPTVTDAHVLRGRIDASRILGRDGGVELAPVEPASTGSSARHRRIGGGDGARRPASCRSQHGERTEACFNQSRI